MILEDVLTEDEFDKLLLELYATDDIYRLIVYEDDEDDYTKSSKILINPKFNFKPIGKNQPSPKQTLVWKRKKNNTQGGCDRKWSSICAISDDIVVIVN